MSYLYLVRHGETDWNRAHRIQGSSDIPLNDTGRAQAARTAALLARRQWDAIYSSPLSRAFETATIIGATLGLANPELISSLAERHYGVAEGLTGREIAERYPGSTAVPGRESRENVAARVMPALLEIAATGSDRRVIVTTHGAVIRTVLLSVKAPVERGIPITNGSIHSFRRIGNSLELIEFDDPIELDSVVQGEEDFGEQNLLEDREEREVQS
ncbi:MAG: histidine phosphatase family protein [Terrimesophilobacter sp.]